jgi:hypothetical protein
LFPDIKEKDRCFDGACFNIKRGIALFTKVKELVEKEPDTIFLTCYARDKSEQAPQNIMSFLSSQKFKVLGDNDFSTYSQSWNGMVKKITGFMLNGDRAGHKVQVFVKGKAESTNGKASSTDKPTEMIADDKKEAIARIKERTKRAAELDSEKVYARVLEEVTKHDKCLKQKEETPEKKLSEWGLLAALVYDGAGYGMKEEINKAFKLTSKLDSKQEAKIFESMELGQLMWMVRNVAIHKYSSPYNHDKTEGLLIREVAKGWGVDVDGIEKDQLAIRTKREARAKERIEELSKKPAKKAKATA